MKKTFLLSFLLTIIAAFQLNAQVTTAHLLVSGDGGGNPLMATNYFEDALTTMGIATTVYTDDNPGAFLTALAAANPATDLFIMDNWNFGVGFDGSNLVNFITAGGRVIFSSWVLNSNPATRAALGVNSATNNGTNSYSIYDWGGSDIFNGLPNPTTFTQIFGFGVATTRFQMTPAGAATVAGFVPGAGTPNEGAIIIANGGNTIAFGACINIATNASEGQALALNVVQAVSGMSPTVPTMGEWGLIILALLVLSFGTVFMMRRQTAIAGMGNMSVSSGGGIPFDKASFGKMLVTVLLGLAATFAIAVLGFGYEMTSADVPGALIAAPVAAYLVHLLFGKKNGQ